METLKELRAKYKQLKKERDDIYNKIRILEKKEILSNFVVGNCYFDIEFNTLIKIVARSNSYVYYICVDEDYIGRDSSYIYDLEECWNLEKERADWVFVDELFNLITKGSK